MKATGTVGTIDLAGYLSKATDVKLYSIGNFMEEMLKGEKKGEYKGLETILAGVNYEISRRRFKV